MTEWPLEFKQTPLTDRIQDNEDFKCKYITKSDPLGDGHFSTVKQCMNIHTKDFYAMKLIRKDIIKDKLQLIRREFHLLKYLSQQIRFLEQPDINNNNNRSNYNPYVDTFQGHHHILQLFDYFETTANIVLITQLCNKDDLYEKIISNGHLDLSKQVVPYTACLISVLDFLHSQGVIHRDIKAENILFRLNKNSLHPHDLSSNLSNNNNKNNKNNNSNDYDLTAHDLILGDFGLALDTQNNNLSDMDLKEYVGTMSYIAPEVVRCKGINLLTFQEIQAIKPYDSKIDIWALGVLVYFMATGYTPFDCETDEETLQCISNCDYYIDETLANDPEYKDFWNFIQCCFVKDSQRRRSAKSLKSHPFISDFFAPAPNVPVSFYSQRDNDSINSSSVVGFPLLKKNKSLTSLSNLKISPSRTQASSLLNTDNTQSSLLLSSKLGQWTIIPDSNSNSQLLQPQPTVHNSHYPNGLAPLTPFTPSAEHHTGTNSTNGTGNQPAFLNNGSKSKDALRRTLSTTSLKTKSMSVVPSSLAISSFPSGDQLTRGDATNSTFFLDPQPPKASLMNGMFCETPESLSNFNTTPRSSLSLSRHNSNTNELSNLEPLAKGSSNNASNNKNQYALSRSASYTNVKKSCFQLEYDDD